MHRYIRTSFGLIVALGLLAACGETQNTSTPQPEERRETIWDLFQGQESDTNVQVNKFLWNASLDVLGFLPLEAADPFTGVIVMGWGTAPGSSQRYRATVLISEPALSARSLKVSVQTSSGAASAETQRRIEDAILTRARQLRIQNAKL